MIERLAQLIYADMAYDGPGEKPAWVDGGNSFKQDEARKKARRYLEAMREPTLEMIGDVAEMSRDRYGAHYTAFGPIQWHYTAMIDAALSQ